MIQPKATRTVTIINRAGFHVRPASLVTQAAGRFRAQVALVKDRQRFNARSMIELLGLNGRPGEQVVLEATGEDAEAAVEAIAKLFADKFNEDDMEG
jgi:phosphotransferase system HPr (HPr) family protein